MPDHPPRPVPGHVPTQPAADARVRLDLSGGHARGERPPGDEEETLSWVAVMERCRVRRRRSHGCELQSG
eukprot:852406-Prorocentrum_minimum.AAC.1